MRATTQALFLVATLGVASPGDAQRGPTYSRVHRLTPREGVFAYARISPDGNRLVYASNIPRGNRAPVWMETIVELATGHILWTGRGVDAYWSPEGRRIIYLGDGVVVRDVETGIEVKSEAARNLGDYFSWADRDGRDLILTIDSRYYYLDANSAQLPARKVAACPSIGTGERPLISKDGRRITTFVRGNVVVRGLDNCDDILDTGIQGGKADFSWDGRYVAFHSIKDDGSGYDIRIVDTKERTVRTLALAGGSTLFPSWTKDGRLCFRYDGPDYRGFVMASKVLDLPARPLREAQSPPLRESRYWNQIFPNVAPKSGVQLVLIWAPWSAHSQFAFSALNEAQRHFGAKLGVLAAADPLSLEGDVDRQLREFRVTIPRVRITVEGLRLTEARNQLPTLLLFRDGVLVDQRLGSQPFANLKAWVDPILTERAAPRRQ